ncbi:serine-aspartate repeat-containing protein D-like [Eriocheir sinensis]|uniref:serine-aspartate repeat-containing protein D-like n=1 Tax=Eriocheir sinensis TaxID=95602 RepID=UPI0021C702B9|nr:serine-aspartate repeat-containing protein D-like [Eriocheir sinensis]XP_050722496.1 serine-aspartate repeat-containing protein D-like [Eriocheir sinensis]
MKLLMCITVVSVVSAIGKAALVPYTLGDTTIMVESSILGYNSPLLSYLKQGMAHRRGDNTDTDLQADSSSQSSDPLQEATGEEEKLSSGVSEIDQQFTSTEEFYAKPSGNVQTGALPQDTISQEAADDEKLSSGTSEGQHFTAHKDFQTNSEGSLAIKVLPDKFTSSDRPTPITMHEAAGIYFEGQRVPIAALDNTPPLYYNVHTPDFAQVSEKIHNIVTSLSPKHNDRAPGSSRHPPLRNAVPLQLHARPGDTPPSLANTEGFTGVSVKHMVPQEPSSFEDYTTNNGDLNFLLSSDPLQQSDPPKSFGHDRPSLLPSDKPAGHIWGPQSDMSQHTRIQGDDEVIISEHPSSFGTKVTSEQDLEPESSSDSQAEGSEMQITITNTGADDPNAINTDIDILESITQMGNNHKLINKDTTTILPEVVDTDPITAVEVNTGPPTALEMDVAPEEVDNLTSSIPQEGEDATLTTEESYHMTPLAEEKFSATPSIIDETDTVTPTNEESGTADSVVDELDTVTSTVEGMDTATPGVGGMETTTPTVEMDTTPIVDWDDFLVTKMKDLQREEIHEAVLGAEEEKDQEALDQAMADLFNLFNTDNDTQTHGESETQNWQNNSAPVTESDKESVSMLNNNDSNNDQNDYISFPTTTFQTLAEQHTSRPHLFLNNDPLTSLSDSFEALLTDQDGESHLGGTNHSSQDHLHYSAVANFPTTRDEPGPPSPDQQGTSNLRHDLPHSEDQEGLKSWFDREPITIFDPLHIPSPGSPLPQGFYDFQLGQDKITTTQNSGITLDDEHNMHDLTTQMTPQSSSESDESNTSTDGGSDISALQEGGVTDDSALPVDDDDTGDLGTLQNDDGPDNDLVTREDDDSGNSGAFEEEDDDNDSDNSATFDDNRGDSDDSPVLDDDNEDDSDDSATLENGDDDSDDSATLDDDNGDDSDDSAKLDNDDDDSDDSATPDNDDDDSDDLATLDNDDDDSDDSAALDNDDDDSDDSATLGDNDDDLDDSATLGDNNDDLDDSATLGDNDDDSDDSATLGDNDDDLDDSATLDDDEDDSAMADDEDDDSDGSATPLDIADILHRADSNASVADDFGNTSSSASTSNTSSSGSPSTSSATPFPGAVLHNAGPEIFQKSSCLCGLRFAPKVVGGQDTTIYNYPWMTAIVSRSSMFIFCAGSIINEGYILTAAHCIHGKNPNDLFVRLGATNRNDPGAITMDVKALIPHQKYDPSVVHKFDIGLIQLAKLIDYSDVVFPACLAPPELNLSGKSAMVTGWGKDKYGGNLEEVLQEATVTVLPTNTCRKDSLYEKGQVHKKIICASGAGTDACQGDSGGPLMVLGDNKSEVVGLVSWGVGCGEPKYPGIYTRISAFENWIKKNMHGVRSCLPSFTTTSKKKKKNMVKEAVATNNNKRRKGQGSMNMSSEEEGIVDTHTKRRKGQGNKKRKHQKNKASQEEEMVNENDKRRKGQGKEKNKQGNRDSEEEDMVNTNANRKKGSGNKRKQNKNKLNPASSQENVDTESAEENQSQEAPNSDEGTIADVLHSIHGGANNNYNIRKTEKKKVPAVIFDKDSDEDNTEDDDWSSIPGALRNIAKIISRESNTDE